MPLTFKQFKDAIRSRVFPSGESRNLKPAHDKSIVDALVDLQRWVECLQSNNTHLVPHCSTFFNCGLTSFDFPRSRIMRLSVIDKINAETHKEDATAGDDWCSEIEYHQIDACHMRSFLGKTSTGCCGSIAQYFAIPPVFCGNKTCVPVPTDEGVLPTLPTLRMGYHYPQESTNATCRARRGVWAVENGRVYLAPWIQSTETAVVKWHGIKRDWVDADLVDDDPGLLRAVELFLRWENARDWGKNFGTAAAYEVEYRKALADLMYDCAEENRVRSCESERDGGAGGARGIAPLLKLYYNDQQTATAKCAGNQSGGSATSTVLAGSVASSVSVGDANELAYAQALADAQSKLDCGDSQTSYEIKVVGHASCQPIPGASLDTPRPEGVDVIFPLTVRSTSGDVAGATAEAQATADAEAMAQLVCTFWNAPQTQTYCCKDAPEICATADVPFHADGCSAVASGGGNSQVTAQGRADQLARDKALELAKSMVTCPEPVVTYYNEIISLELSQTCNLKRNNPACTITAFGTINPGVFSWKSQGNPVTAKAYVNCLAEKNLTWKLKCELKLYCAIFTTERTAKCIGPEPFTMTQKFTGNGCTVSPGLPCNENGF